jgi:hypothetical protein
MSPLTLVCPLCGAKAGHECVTPGGEFSAVHVLRITATAAKGATMKRKKFR